MHIEGRSVFGYFSDRNAAVQALQRLQQAGFSHAQLDSLSLTSQRGRLEEVVNPSTGDFGSLSQLTMGETPASDSAGILLSADPSASGYATGDVGAEGHGWMVVAVTDGSDVEVERAVKILKSHGGDV